jgi:hypothetical protein
VTFIQFVAFCGGCDQLTLLFDKNLLTPSSSVRFAKGVSSGEGIIEPPVGILYTRSITGGSITTIVPEPSQLTIFLVILLGLLLSRAVFFGKFRV